MFVWIHCIGSPKYICSIPPNIFNYMYIQVHTCIHIELVHMLSQVIVVV